MKKILRLGTRGSPLAIVQAEEVRAKLLAAHTDLHDEIEIVPIRTSGDWRPEHKERTFLEVGGDKGFFTKEIEDALMAGVIDMAVHSMKDVPSRLPDQLDIAALLARADPRDAFISGKARTLARLPAGATIGTASLRRQAQILARRPDLRVVPLRGNVDTRLRKLANGEADATILALAGMRRLGIADRASSILDTDEMLPAAAQGALGVEIRRDDEEVRRLLVPVNCVVTAMCVNAERALLLALDGSCHTPIAVLAVLKEAGQLTLDALAARPDGSEIIRMSRGGKTEDAGVIGRELGEAMKRRLPPDFFAGGVIVPAFMTSVLITRPRPASEDLASVLQGLGYETAVEPLFSIAPTNVPRMQIGAIDAVMITSGNALPALEGGKDGISDLLDTPCFCVGPRTAEKARVFGFRQTQSATSDGVELAQFISRSRGGKGTSVLHIAGRDVDSNARQELERLGHRVIDWPVYKATPVATFSPAALDLLAERKLDAIVVYSPQTARTLRMLLAAATLEACCETLAAICLSEAVADVLRPLGWRCLAAAPMPTEDAVIACLQKVCPVKL